MQCATFGRLRYLNAGFLWQRRVRRIARLAGFTLQPGLPRAGEAVAVWGRSPHARRGERAAARAGVPLVRIEDAFLRSLFPGRAGRGEAPMGLLIDTMGGVHFDAGGPSSLEHLLATHPLDDTPLLARARNGIARLRAAHLSKYCAVDPETRCPAPGYVLVVDQVRGDASVVHGGGVAPGVFNDMLRAALDAHHGARVVIKTHPETAQGLRPGHFGPGDTAGHGGRVRLLADPVSPWHLLEGAVAVYTLSSQMGFEAILAGHRPQVFGRPFYAGWGLTDDHHPEPMPRRRRRLSATQLFAAAMILAPVWYDPFRDRAGRFEQVLDTLEAQARAWRDDRHGWQACGMRLWKRRPLQRFFGHTRRVRFAAADAPPPVPPRRAMVWAGRAGVAPPGAVRVEDGLLRSRGLGAALVPPLSLVLDDLGIYYDPTVESRLERLIAARARLRPDQQTRAEALIAAMVKAGLSKYNLTDAGPAPAVPADLSARRPRILVAGQVEDDASIRLGAGAIASNLALLERVRAEDPDATILYKPHPDVEAGLRPGRVPESALTGLADAVLLHTDAAAALAVADAVWTMTSGLGFEALLRELPVTTTGAPFYAGWGLTRDLGRVPARRSARPGLAGLVHAVLIDYPRYRDPVTGRACPPEVAVDRLTHGPLPAPGPGNRALARLQGLLASRPGLWRR